MKIRGRRIPLQMVQVVGICLVLVISPVAAYSPQSLAHRPPPGLEVLETDPGGLTLQWIAPLVNVRLRDDNTLELTAEGCDQTQTPGWARLPFISKLIALPPDAQPHIQILAIEERAQALPAPIASAPQPVGVIRDAQGRPIGGGFTTTAPQQIDAVPTPAELEEVGLVRGVRLARLTLYPAIPERKTLRVIRRLQIRVSWDDSKDRLPPPTDPMLDRVQAAVLNPQHAIPEARSGTPTTWQEIDTASATAFLEMTSAGPYRVTREDLDGLGFAAVDPHNLRLFQGKDEVAYEWEGDDDEVFEAGEALAFYASPRFSRWSETDAYRLVGDATAGLRMESRSADPTGLPAGLPWMEQTVEENHFYTPDCLCGRLPPGRDGDRWTWRDLRQPDRPTGSFTFSIPTVDASQAATLTAWLIGYTDVPAEPDHRIDAAVNGAPLGHTTWDGKTAYTATLAIPTGVLQNGLNTLTLNLPGVPDVSVEGTWLDAFAVHYARSNAATGRIVHFEGEAEQQAYTVALTSTAPYRAYDITDALTPRRLTEVQVSGNTVTVGDPATDGPRRYIVSESNLPTPDLIRAPEDPWTFHQGSAVTGADLLIITHPLFADALDPLIDLRRSAGLSTVLVNVLGIYDTWGDGRREPEAIRSFIAAAYETWNPRPTYVLLVGDGSFDPRQYRPGSPVTFIPPYLADVDPWAGETAADNRYVCVDGDDALPDLLLGRLPVQSTEEIEAVVEKTVGYEVDPFPGEWNADVLLVADDTDTAGDFGASSDDHAAVYVHEPFTVTRRYCSGTDPYTSDCEGLELDELTIGIRSDWDGGAFLIQFTGHSSWHQWAAERFLHVDDLPSLSNDRRWPIVTEMTCFTGAFQRTEPTLDESLVTAKGSGAVVAWGATGLGVGTGHAKLSAGFFNATFTDQVETPGEAALAGKLNLAAAGQHLDLLDTFNLLGDVALLLNRTLVPWLYNAYLPVTLRNG